MNEVVELIERLITSHIERKSLEQFTQTTLHQYKEDAIELTKELDKIIERTKQVLKERLALLIL